MADKYEFETKQGWPVLEISEIDSYYGQLIALVYHPMKLAGVLNSREFIIALGYSPERGDWGQGSYHSCLGDAYQELARRKRAAELEERTQELPPSADSECDPFEEAGWWR